MNDGELYLIQERIDNYLLNRMSPEERSEFERELAGSSELRDQLQFTQRLKQVIASQESKLTKVKQWEAEARAEESDACVEEAALASETQRETVVTTPLVPTTANRRRRIYWISGIAALFVVGFFVVYTSQFGGTSTDSNAVEQTSPTPSPAFRGGTSYTDIERLVSTNATKALKSIEAEETKLADEQKTTAADQSIPADERDYNLQLLRLNADQLTWLRANALLRLGRTAEARAALTTLRQSSADYQAVADSLLRTLTSTNPQK